MREVRIVARAVWGTIATRARVLGMTVAGVVAVVVALVVAARVSVSVESATAVIDGLGLSLMIPAASLVFGVAALGDPIDDRTLVYLWLRPVERERIVGGAAIAALGVSVPLGVVPVVAVAWITSKSASIAAATALAAVLASVASTSLFVLLGSITQRALAWGIGYVLIYEKFIARGGKGLGFFSVHSHAVSILARRSRVDMTADYFSVGTSVVVMVAFSALALAGATWRMHRLEVA